MGHDSVVGIATCHGLEFWWGRAFLRPSSLALESIQPPVQCVLAVFLWGKMARDWHLNAYPSIAHRLETAEISLLHFWVCAACSGVNVTLPLRQRALIVVFGD